MVELVLFGILVSVFISYISYIIYNYGILSSISQSYYELPKNKKKLFIFFCWGFSIPVIILGTLLTDNLLIFLAGSGIVFVGASAKFKKQMTSTVHTIGAAISILFSQASIFFDFNMLYLNIIFLILSFLIILFKKVIKNYIFWIEILTFISIFITFYLILF